MNWWWRHRGYSVLVLLVPGTVAAAAAAGGLAVPLPQLTGTAVTTPVAAFLALIPSTTLARCLERRSAAVECGAVRPIAGYDAALMLLVAATFGLVAVLLRPFDPRDLLALVARDTAMFSGLVALSPAALGATTAASIPATYLIAASLLGGGPGGGARGWALPLHDPHSVIAAAAAAVLLAAGAVALAVTRRRAPVTSDATVTR